MENKSFIRGIWLVKTMMIKEKFLVIFLILLILIPSVAFCYYGAKVEFLGSVDFDKLKYVKGCEVTENFGSCKIFVQGYDISINFTQKNEKVSLAFVLSPDPQFTEDTLKMQLNYIIREFENTTVLKVNEDMDAVLSRITPLGSESQVATSYSQVTPIVRDIVKELMKPYEPYITLSLKLFIVLLVVSIAMSIISTFLKARYEKKILNELREIKKLLENYSPTEQ